MAKFGSLAAGALAATTAMSAANEAAAQATEWVVPLETGGQIVMNVEGVSSETQQRVFAELQACVGAAEVTRDECLAAAAVMMASERLNTVVRDAHLQLTPLEEEVGMSVAELIQAPEFCDFAETDATYETCVSETDDVEVASLELQIASVKANVISSRVQLTQVKQEADDAEHRADAAERLADNEEVRADEAERLANAAAAQADAAAQLAEEAQIRADAARAVLEVLQQIAAEELVMGEATPDTSS